MELLGTRTEEEETTVWSPGQAHMLICCDDCWLKEWSGRGARQTEGGRVASVCASIVLRGSRTRPPHVPLDKSVEQAESIQ